MVQEMIQTAAPQTVPVTNLPEGKRYENGGPKRQNGFGRWDHQQSGTGQINISNGQRTLLTVGGAALLLYAVQRRSLTPSLIGGATGLMLLYSGVTGYSPLLEALNISTASADDKGKGVRVDVALTVNRSIEDVYAYWRNLENLPNFMWHVKQVRNLDAARSHWVVEVSPKLRLEWDARIMQDLPNELIAWQTEPGAVVENGGAVRFQKAPADRGTEIHASIRYDPPGGFVGEAVAGLFKTVTQQQIKEDIRRFKQILETGEIATTEGQSRCE